MQGLVEWAILWSLQLQLWGGILYFLHKVFCSRYERTKRNPETAQRWRTRSWIVYIAGLPAVVALLLTKDNWIFAALEASAFPAMVLGLVLAIKRVSKDEIDKKLSRLDPFMYIAIGFGLGYSYHLFNGFTTLNQILEMGAAFGFLVGTYQQAKDDEKQYLSYIVMNLSAGILLWRENYIWFTLQQIASIAFIADAWLVRRRIASLSARAPAIFGADR